MFNFPAVVRPTNNYFDKNLLQSVIFQIKFPANAAVLQRKESWISALKQSFPVENPTITGQISFQLKDKTPLLQSTSTTDGLELKTQDSSKVLRITTDSLTFTCLGKSYTSFENVFTEIFKHFSQILLASDIKVVTRCAIRKINVLEFQSNSSSRGHVLPLVFNKSLVDNFLSVPGFEFLAAGTSTFSLAKDAYKLNCTYGLLGHQLPGDKGQVILDIDLFAEGKEIEVGNVAETFKSINSEIYNIFMWAMSPTIIGVINQNNESRDV